jgi:signal transduction histidine kinase
MKSYRSIRNKILAVVFLATFSALFVAGAIFLVYDINSFRNTHIDDMRTQISLLGYSSVPALQFTDPEVAKSNLKLLERRPSIIAAAIYDSRGRLFANYLRLEAIHEFPALPASDTVTIDGSQIHIFTRIIENGEILGTAYMVADYELQERVTSFVQILSLVAVVAMLVAGLVSLWLQSVITSPILSVVNTAREVISNKQFTQHAKKMSEDEVGVLVDAFNDMLDEIASRTSALESSNKELNQEVAERMRAREEVLKLNDELEHKVMERTQQLQLTNQELETFCYSVSHDLRGPLRSISGFSQALLEELPAELPGDARRYFDKITAATQRMGQLIEDLLNLSRVSRGELIRQEVNCSELATEILNDLKQQNPTHKVHTEVWTDIVVNADQKLLRIVFENLLGNAWKFSSKQANPRIEVGTMRDGKRETYFVRDNGAGFDMKYADKLFGPFQRLHAMNEYPGTGIGLATVQRIIHRHGGRIWFDSKSGQGAVFYFTLDADFNVSEHGQA